eukprot:886717_1
MHCIMQSRHWVPARLHVCTNIGSNTITNKSSYHPTIPTMIPTSLPTHDGVVTVSIDVSATEPTPNQASKEPNMLVDSVIAFVDGNTEIAIVVGVLSCCLIVLCLRFWVRHSNAPQKGQSQNDVAEETIEENDPNHELKLFAMKSELNNEPGAQGVHVARVEHVAQQNHEGKEGAQNGAFAREGDEEKTRAFNADDVSEHSDGMYEAPAKTNESHEELIDWLQSKG